MKKVLLTVISFAALATASFAQTRTIDLSVEAIIAPDSVKSSASSTSITFDVLLKNNSLASILSGDSIWYNFIILDQNSQKIIGYPSFSNPNLYNVSMVSSTVLPGDSMHLNVTASLGNIVVLNSINITITFKAHVINRPNLDFEASANQANNSKSKSMVWFNQHGWYVGVDGAVANSTKVYPNPVKDVLNVEVNYDLPKVLNIFDITGKKVEEINFTDKATTVNVGHYNRGFYFYEIRTTEGEMIQSGKLQVN